MEPDQTRATLELASRVYNSPLAIHGDVLQFISWCKLDAEDLARWMEAATESPEPVGSVTGGGVAVIPIRGSLFRGTFFSDYDVIGDSLDAALADPDVSSILLDVDSPGGEVRGMFDLADRIYEARGQKPIVALADDQATSAAYALASAADTVVASPTATVGSIGVVAVHVDQSKATEHAGLKMTEIASGKNKTALSPNRPLSELGRGILEKAVDSSAEQFFDLVARNRGISTDSVRAQEAGVFTAKEALKNGLVDRVAMRGSVLQEMTGPEAIGGEMGASLSAEIPVTTVGDAGSNQPATTETEGSHNMATTEETTEVVEETPLAEIEETVVAEAPEADAPVDELEAVRAEARADATKEAREIVELCTLAGVPADAATFIAAGESVENVRSKLLEAKATQGESLDINNTVDALNSASSPQVELDPDAIYKARREIGRR